ncbi:hypothetical protein Tco_0540022 [Tanacetum coccineum]
MNDEREGTSDQNNITTQSIIEGHLSALKELLKQQGNRDLIKPMLLNFNDDSQDTDDEKNETNKGGDKGKKILIHEDSSKPFKEVLKCPFTSRIIEFSSLGHRMPTNVKIYDRTGDPKDHISRFTRIWNQGEWPMPRIPKDNRAILTLGSLVSTPKEILATEHQLCLPQPPPLVEIALEFDKLNHLVKDMRQRGKGGQKGSGPQKGKDLLEEALMVEAEVEGYLVRMIHESGKETSSKTIQRGRSARESKPNKKVLVKPAYPDKLVAIGKNLSPVGSAQFKSLLKKNKDIFAWESSDMIGVPRRIIKNALNANPSITPVSQKRRVFSLENIQVVTQEVVEWLKADIVRPVRYLTWISNPVLVKKEDRSWRMCIDFKNINSTCLKDYYPLPEIDLKIESVMGYPLKCFLDTYKGYHQVQMAEEDE